jgi:6-pyruvoyltetrahydropterin/6-carboxytetrahydropterin synthase
MQKNGREEIEFRLCGKRYVLPSDEVVLLKVDNITCERLARAYFEFLLSDMEPILKKASVSSMSVYIEESPGQGAAYTHAF